jgi:hypothetical protein
VLLLCLTGCDALFRLGPVEEPVASDAGGDGGSSCFAESFDGTDQDLLARWNRGNDNAACKATVDSGELLIAIESSSDCYAFASPITSGTFVGNSASVHVTKIAETGNAETMFVLRRDQDNSYFFNVDDGELAFRARVNSVDLQQKIIAYDATAHAYWRFEYRAVPPGILFQTSSDGESWITRHEVDALVPLDTLSPMLITGTYTGGLAEVVTARFDDFERCSP